MMKGRINSFQSMGAVDGPGIRYVIFMQGCPLRCVYCHNPDTWDPMGGEAYSAEEIINKVLRLRSYFGEDGGVTVSGGEPLLQWEFVAELFQRLKREGIHTALDTSGAGDPEGAERILKHTDLVLCDLKFSTEEDYHKNCGGSLEKVISFLKQTEQMEVPVWIRHVVVPGLTDNEEQIGAIAQVAFRFSNVKKLELLPFKKMCKVKYDALGIPFPLKDYSDCSAATIEKLQEEIKAFVIKS